MGQERRGGRRVNAGRPPVGAVKTTEAIRIRVSADTKAALLAVCALNRISVAAFVREAVEEAVADCSDKPIFARRVVRNQNPVRLLPRSCVATHSVVP